MAERYLRDERALRANVAKFHGIASDAKVAPGTLNLWGTEHHVFANRVQSTIPAIATSTTMMAKTYRTDPSLAPPMLFL